MPGNALSAVLFGAFILFPEATSAVDVALCTGSSFVDCTTYSVSSAVCSKFRTRTTDKAEIVFD